MILHDRLRAEEARLAKIARAAKGEPLMLGRRHYIPVVSARLVGKNLHPAGGGVCWSNCKKEEML